MSMTTGLMPNLRLQQPDVPAAISPEDVIVEIVEDADEPTLDMSGNIMEIIHGDGSISISLDGKPIEEGKKKEKGGWFDNLVDDIDDQELGRIADELIRGITDDTDSRKEWVEDRAQGIKLLGLKIEIPGLAGAADGAPVEGMSKVRHPLLLEAVLRFQANARSELLPTDGPVKVRDDATHASMERNLLADALEKDLNHYLTTTASEYYPDTDRMLLMLGFGGTAFKKIYFCPLRNRPIIESVDADDMVVNNAATDLRNAKRITHRVYMRPSTVKRLQILGVYRDIELSRPSPPQLDSVQREQMSQQGISTESFNPDDRDREIYECYCELDIKGFEHKFKGKESGLEIPYRVTIDVSSKQILSIARNYDEVDGELPEARSNFVKYTFVPGMGFYDIGLLHILGNTTNAITAAWRELLDAGMYANFPGFLMADTGARQNTNIFRVPPGGGALVKTGGLSLAEAIMPLPYKEPSSALMSLVQNMAETGMRIGGTSEQQVGEGRADAAVGTTLAQIEQATKVMNAVHKRMHAAQAEEFQLLVRCFKEHPESFWQRCKRPTLQWSEQTFLAALEDCELVPQADPNTASHAQRVMKVMAIKQLQAANPMLYDAKAVDTAVLQSLGWNNPDQFFVPPNPNAPPPPEVQKGMAEIQIKQQDATTRAKLADAKIAEMSGGQGLGLPGGLDPAKIAEFTLKKQDMDIKEKAADAKMLNDQAKVANDQAKLQMEQARAAKELHNNEQNPAEMANLSLQQRELMQKHQDSVLDAINRKRDRESRERLAAVRLAENIAKDPSSMQTIDQVLTPGVMQRLEENEAPLPNNIGQEPGQ
jgi:hypothetical protein